MSVSTSVSAISPARSLAAWVELTKPRIVMLVLFTGLPALLLAGHGVPAPQVLWGAVFGITLSAASGAAFNHYFDRDIDALMVRTRLRPLPAGLVPPAGAAALGCMLAWGSWVVLSVTCNALAARIAMASIFYYAVVYTVWLKRRTPQNIVIGGAAGASAPLIAWAAVTGHVGLPAVLMAGVIFMWTPPHFWALSLYRRDDYARAGVPMLPVTHGEPATRVAILRYAVALVAVSLAVGPLAGLGPLYLFVAAGLGGWFVLGAWRLWRAPETPKAVRLFRFSILYLFGLFLVMLVEAVLRARGA